MYGSCQAGAKGGEKKEEEKTLTHKGRKQKDDQRQHHNTAAASAKGLEDGIAARPKDCVKEGIAKPAEEHEAARAPDAVDFPAGHGQRHGGQEAQNRYPDGPF